MFIEAKREGIYFELPRPHSNTISHRYIKVNTLLTDPATKKAITQVFNYCMNEGCEFASVTNGHEWIFFKVFEKGKSWKDLRAFVISGLDFFCNSYTKAYNIFSYKSLVEDNALSKILSQSKSPRRDIFFAKEHIASYSEQVIANRFAARLRPLFEKYFTDLLSDDNEFVDKCYVAIREYKSTYKGVYALIKDSLSPYFKRQDIKDFIDDDAGGLFGKRVTTSLQQGRKNEVIVLFGGKGSGKSTFLRKLLYHKTPAYIKKHSKVAIVNLLDTTESEEIIRSEALEQTIAALDSDGILKGDRDQLLYLFSDKYSLAKKQVLFGYEENSEKLNEKTNELVDEWLRDREYCAERIARYWKDRHHGLIIAIDNTDQFQPQIQDHCFALARELSSKLDCLVIISMREERYHTSKIRGILDAFNINGFHIASPFPELVFQKRIEYVLSVISNKEKQKKLFVDIEDERIKEYIQFFKILQKSFKDRKSPLNRFLAASAHGNIRLALDLFRGFVTSGYTNVDEMLSRSTWNIAVHQVIKPFMVPDRFFYDESKSAIPNLFQVRSKRNGSHFTALRVLNSLATGEDPSHPPYVSVAELKEYFSNSFDMVDDLEKNLDVLLRCGFIEANNRIDEYSNSVDSIKITNYGLYGLKELSCYFSYLDLICMDCALFEESVANYLVKAGNEDFKLFKAYKKYERVLKRIEKVDAFVEYLERQELYENEQYGLGGQGPQFSAIVRKCFFNEKPKILRSASRARNQNKSVGTR
jgi:energy-coupling factor transporter ATP-binding protein EcfA2